MKNEEGIGNLFSSGDFIPSSNLKVYGGITFDLGSSSEITRIKNNARNRFSEWQTTFRIDIKKDFEDFIKICTARLSSPASVNKAKKFSDAIPATNTEEFYDAIKDFTDSDATTQLVYDKLIDFTKSRKNTPIIKRPILKA